MSSSNIGMLIASVVLVILGFLLSFRAPFARKMLTLGRARVWNALLGEERALKLTRFVFGPFLILLGLFCGLVTLIVTIAERHRH